MRKTNFRTIFLVLLVLLLAAPILVYAQEKEDKEGKEGGDGGGGGGLASQAQNPVGAMYSLPFKFTMDFGAPDGSAYFLNIQPVIPVTVGNWNLINRVIAPIVWLDGFITSTPAIPKGAPGGATSGIGDINYSMFVSPAKAGKVIWGLGPSINIPSATDNQLGSGKWSAGPTAVLLVQPKPWSLGILGRQLWSFAGDSGRSNVSQFLVEPFINYNLDNGWYLITDMVLTANWNAKSGQRWVVPVGGGVGKIVSAGGQPMNLKVEAYYNVVRPKSAPDWSTSFTMQFMFPKK